MMSSEVTQSVTVTGTKAV